MRAEGMVTKLLRRVVPTPLQPSVRKAILWPRRLLRLLRRMRRRLLKSLRRVRRRPRQLWHRHLKHIWRRQLKPIWQGIRLRAWHTWHVRSCNRSAEISNEIHLIFPLRAFGGGPLRALRLFEELKDLRKVTLWSEYEDSWSEDKVGSEIAETPPPVRKIVPERFEFPKT